MVGLLYIWYIHVFQMNVGLVASFVAFISGYTIHNRHLDNGIGTWFTVLGTSATLGCPFPAS